MKKIILLMWIFCAVTEVSAQTAKRPFLAKKGIPVIFDTDMGNDIDDAMAIDMLFKYMDQSRINLIGITNNKDSDYSTRYLNLLCNWYGYPNIPIGKIKDGVKLNDYVDYSKNVVEMNQAEGEPYKYSNTDYNGFLDADKLYRKLLASQPNNSVVIVSVGFSTNLYRLLMSEPDEYSKLNGKELVAKKVAWLSVMGGSFGEKKRAEFNIVNDIVSAQYVFENWPTGIALSPFEVGAKVVYPAASISNDFGWTEQHLLVDSYKKYRKFPYNRPTWDLTSVYYVAEPTDNLLDTSLPGTLKVDEKGFMFFEENAKGKHYVLSIKPQNAVLLKEYFIDLIKQKPKKYQ